VPKTPTAPATLAPLFKWTGGKRREIARFSPHYPAFVTAGERYRYVEPFVGGGAVYWSLANPDSVINDWDGELINFYRVAARQDPQFLTAVDAVSALFGPGGTHDQRAQAYYDFRNLDRAGGLARCPDWQRAARFFIVNQLAFSGMRRFNAAGEFNVPFGHYTTLNASALRSSAHAGLLATTDIRQGSYDRVLEDNDKPNTFIYVDPPYTRVMKTYSAGATFGDQEQLELRDRLAALKHASFMVVIDKSELTEGLYRDFIVHVYPVRYGVNIKNRFSQGAEHVVACNYVTAAGAVPPSWPFRAQVGP